MGNFVWGYDDDEGSVESLDDSLHAMTAVGVTLTLGLVGVAVVMAGAVWAAEQGLRAAERRLFR
jgi:hypothetical protein